MLCVLKDVQDNILFCLAQCLRIQVVMGLSVLQTVEILGDNCHLRSGVYSVLCVLKDDQDNILFCPRTVPPNPSSDGNGCPVDTNACWGTGHSTSGLR